MRILLKCKCTDGEVGLEVRDREEGEDIAKWMDAVTERVSAWHLLRACSEPSLEYLKVPLSDGKPLGSK
jgi:hypothetical protein